MKKALILNISHNELRCISALKQLGYYVIGTGNNPKLPGKNHTDEYIQTDYSDKEAVLKLAQENNVNAVIASSNDFGVLTAAYTADALKLPGHDTYQNAMTLHHKDLFKKFAQKHSVPVPFTVCFDNENEAAGYVKKVNTSVIIKPVDLTGGVGISKADTAVQAAGLIKEAFKKSKCKRIVIEEFIQGEQQAISAFLVKGKVAVYCTNDEYSFINPYRVEIDMFPAKNYERYAPFLISEIERIASLLSLSDGIFHAQYIVKNGKPYIIEVMRRTIGNLYGIPAEKLMGVNYELWQVKAQCGYDCTQITSDFSKSDRYYAYRAYMSDKNGVYKGVYLPENYKRCVIDNVSMMNIGESITNFMVEKAAILFFEFDSRSEMENILLEQYNTSYVEIASGS